MSDHNLITVRGRVGTDPEMTITSNERTVAHFRLGSTRRFRDSSGEWRDAETEWFTVKAWGPMADSVVTSINRGMPVIVEGTFSTEEWQSGEQMRHKTVITASAVGVDIRYGLVRYVKVLREAVAAGNGTAAAAAPGATEGSPGAEDVTTGADAAGDLDVDALDKQLGAEPDPWASPIPSSS